MFKNFFGKNNHLAKRCQEYLSNGPPAHMTDYVPESITEIIIAHGAQQKTLDPELKEIASIILIESEDLNQIVDPEIRRYMLSGAELVEEVLGAQ
ncbi:hypothetical protein [Aurantivibrio infirmus]